MGHFSMEKSLNPGSVLGGNQHCSEHRIPVVPQGGLTGLSGGAVPLPGTVALSLTRMNGVISVDRDNACMTVWAGTPLEVAQNAAREVGLDYPVDIGARGSASIGGTIATNAGGIRVLRHGMTRQNVLGLEVVLADGTIMSNLRSMMKDNAGFDLKQMFIGSEGCLGIVTRAVLRLVPASENSTTMLISFAEEDSMLRALASARRAFRGDLVAFEAMWPEYWRIATSIVSPNRKLLNDPGNVAVIVEIADAASRDCTVWLEQCFETGLILDGTLAQSLADARSFWEVREATSRFMPVTGPYLGFDFSMPPSEFASFIRECDEQLASVMPARPMYLGHVADGNIHGVMPVPDLHDPMCRKIEEIVFECLARRQGSITAEHGVGSLKRQWLSKTRSPAEITIMRQLKASLDPRAMLNPGKVC